MALPLFRVAKLSIATLSELFAENGDSPYVIRAMVQCSLMLKCGRGSVSRFKLGVSSDIGVGLSPFDSFVGSSYCSFSCCRSELGAPLQPRYLVKTVVVPVL